MHRVSPLLLALVTVSWHATPLTAQLRLEATPLVGMYIPLGALVDQTSADGSNVLRKRQVGTLVGGARFGVRTGEHAAIELSLAYSPSMVAVTDAFSTVDRNAGVLFASVRAPFELTAQSAQTDWYFHAGPGVGVVARGGGAWAGYEGVMDPAFVMAGGARLHVKRSRLAFRLEIEDFVTWASFNDGLPSRTQPSVHHDLVWSMGIILPLAGR